MKIAVFAAFLLCVTGAFGQAFVGGGALSSQPVVVQFTSHPQQAEQRPMGFEKNLLISSGFNHARGERPLWEVAPLTEPISLGDLARMLKKEHESAKKAEVVWVN